MAAHVRKDSATGFALLTDLASGTPTSAKVLIGDGTWGGVPLSGFPGFYYGSGSDGSLTLVANTVLASGDNVKQYTTVTLAGFRLMHHADDFGLIIYINNTLSMGSGGSIRSLKGAHITGGVAPTGAGDGGTGGGQAGTLYVIVNHITGTGQIGGGWDGLNGEAGAVTGGLSNGVAGATDPGIASRVFGYNLVTIQNTLGKAASAAGYQFGQATAGSASIGNDSIAEITRTCKDFHRFLPAMGRIYHPTVDNDPFFGLASAGGGGGSGADDAADGVNRSAESGGGGGGGACIGRGGVGGNGGRGFDTFNPGAGGSPGAGGGGGGGGFTIVMCASMAAAVTVSAKGGNGGSGGNTVGRSIHPGAGGGGGGGGGVAVCVGPTGAPVTVTAAGGTGGLKGSNDGNAVVCQDGAVGVAGHSHSVLAVA